MLPQSSSITADRPYPTSFSERVKTFNGKLAPRANIAVSPLDAADVSEVVRFCRRHDLSPSVRAGGYGIAGWSVSGDIVIDMSRMREIDIELPQSAEEGLVDYTSLKDMPAAGSKGKARADRGIAAVAAGSDLAPSLPPTVPKPITGTKRTREEDGVDTTKRDEKRLIPALDDSTLRNYDSASQVVADFLRGPALPEEVGEQPRQRPTIRRRLHSPGRESEQASAPQSDLPPPSTRQLSAQTTTSSGQASPLHSLSGNSSPMSRTASTDTSASTPRSSSGGTANFAISLSRRTGASDPFGYMNTLPTSSMFSPPSFSSTQAFSGPSGYISGMSIMPSLGSFSSPQPGLGRVAPPRPIHTHAYITFGAGLRQKEIDIFTSDNALQGVSSLTGSVENGLVPYHIPT